MERSIHEDQGGYPVIKTRQGRITVPVGISVPLILKQKMIKYKEKDNEDINWSAVACAAFEKQIEGETDINEQIGRLGAKIAYGNPDAYNNADKKRKTICIQQGREMIDSVIKVMQGKL